jgi:hypothetical protein
VWSSAVVKAYPFLGLIKADIARKFGLGKASNYRILAKAKSDRK